MDCIDLREWRKTEADIARRLQPTFASAEMAPLWRVTNFSIHILYSSCAQHGVAGPCSHSEDEHILMWLGGRILTNTLAGVKLLLAGYYGPAVALVRDSIETTMLLGLFEAVPADVAIWRSLTPKDRWKRFNPGAVRDKLDGLKVWHRYDAYDRYSAMAGHPNPRSTRLSFSEDRERRMVGPFADAANAEGTLHAIALTASHGAYQIADILKIQERFAVELNELDHAHDAWSHPTEQSGPDSSPPSIVIR